MKRQVTRMVLGATLILGIFGCSTPIRPVAPGTATTKHIVHKNYKVNRPMEAYVGDAMVRVKDYYVTKKSLSAEVVDRDVTIRGGIVTINLHKGDALPIAGTAVVDGQEFTVLKRGHDGPTRSFGLLVDDSGHIYKKVLNNVDGATTPRNVVMVYTFTATPNDATFRPQEKELIDTRLGYSNFEILYTGRDNNSIHLTYREYTPQDMARAAFFQNLTYDIHSKFVRFRNLRIALDEVGNEKIRYRVVQD